MADEKNQNPNVRTVDTTTKPNDPKRDHVKVKFKNPTPARRIIHDGINVEGHQGQGATQKAITIEPGETSGVVTVHKNIVEELRMRNRAKAGSDLIPMSADDNDDGANMAVTGATEPPAKASDDPKKVPPAS
jgi:hypothetical protein